MRAVSKKFLSWLAVVLGFLIGFFALATFGLAWPPFGDNDPGWLLRWISYLGDALLGLVFLAGSIIALRNPKRAGFNILIAMPLVVFCLAYPAAGYLVWHSDGSGWFEPPEIPTAIGLTVLFFLPIFASLLVLRHRTKWAVYLVALTVLLAGTVFGFTHWNRAFLPPFGGWSALFLLFGTFWCMSAKQDWPPLFQPRPRSPSRRVAAFLIICIVVMCVDVVLTFGLSALGSSLFSGDCGGKPLFVHPESRYHAVFTARIIFVGRSIEALTRRNTILRNPKISGTRDSRAGDWGIGVVQEKFWGLPSWSHFVLLTNFIYWKDATYFVDGSRGRGLLSRMLPIVEGRIGCSRTKPVQDAIVDLRALHEAPSATGTRLLGYVREPEVFVGVLAPPVSHTFVPGARIRLSGPAGDRIIMTDRSGVFQEDNLPSGDYTLELPLPDEQAVGFFQHQQSPIKLHVEAGTILEADFDVFWNGRIEGRVKDNFGRPARLWVMLVSADGAQLPGYVKSFLQSNTDGSYAIDKIPPGRYVLVVNPSGPSEGSPYEIQYYPAGLRIADAQVFDLSKGRRLKGVDFKVHALIPRTAKLRVHWPDGKAAASAHIYVAYEHTKGYEPLESTNFVTDSDRDGKATIRVYGGSRVRVFAEQFVDNPKEKWWDTYYSHPFESEASNIPAEVDLVLTSSKP